MKPEDIARVAHEVNRSYCSALGDPSQKPWEEAPDWQKTSAVNGVNFHLANPDAKPSESHENWLKEKLAAGWKLGPVKNEEKKEHPCCIGYEMLPLEQRAKDFIFIGVVRALKDV